MTIGTTPSLTTGRVLAPDLSRGLMLMLIAMANIPIYLWGSDRTNSVSHPTEGTILDRIAQFATMIFVDQRVYPMFAFLFGYGMVQFAASRRARGVDERGVRRMLRRRHWALVGFGALHAALLFPGDILGTYGLAGLVLVWLFFVRRNTTVVIWTSIMGAVLAIYLAVSMVSAFVLASFIPDDAYPGFESAAGEASYPASILSRLADWAIAAPSALIIPVIPICILLAWLAARHRVLEEPGRHLKLLRWTAAVGLGVGVAGGVVHALGHVGALGTPSKVWWVYLSISTVTGLFGGLGYVALFGLVAHRIEQRRRRNPERTSLLLDLTTAVGKRSLSCYLAQSLVFAPVLCAWGLGVGGWLGSAGAFVLACLTWLVIAVVALALERSGRRGPAEVALRALTYVGPAGRPASTGAA